MGREQRANEAERIRDETIEATQPVVQIWELGGAIRIAAPENTVIALGLLELAKQMVVDRQKRRAAQKAAAQASGIVGASAATKLPPLEDVLGRRNGRGGKG